MKALKKLFRPNVGDIVETVNGEKGVVVNDAIDSQDVVMMEVRHSDGKTHWYDAEELVRVDRLYKVIDRICNWLGV